MYMLRLNRLLGCKSGLKPDGRFQRLIIGPAGFKTGRPALKRAGFTIGHNIYMYIAKFVPLNRLEACFACNYTTYNEYSLIQ